MPPRNNPPILANHWNPFNLRSTPFFQDTLRSGSDARYPIRLFIGREREAKRLLRTITGGYDSRQTIVGTPGYGKTTLAQYVKHRAAAAGILSSSDPVSLRAVETADQLLMRLLKYVYDTLFSHAAGVLAHTDAMRTTQQLVRAFRIRSGGANVSLLGVGGGGSVNTQFVQSSLVQPSMVVPELLSELIRTARDKVPQFQGIVLHLNNLENVSESDIERARTVMRDLRDVFLLDGYHTLVVGTPAAVASVFATVAQLRSVFTLTEPLTPLTVHEFLALLKQRYAHLKLDAKRPVKPPIETAAITELYTLFGGDLRALLKAVDYAASELLGYSSRVAASPMTLADIRAVLPAYYARESQEALSPTALEHLLKLGEWRETSFVQNDLALAWRISQPRVSKILAELQQCGYVREVERQARQIRYMLTGPALVLLEPGKSGRNL